MVQYDKRILNNLIDSYENSLLFTGENKVSIHISFVFSEKNIPEYFDESSTAYENIHASLKELERIGFVRLIWKKGKENHILQKVLLEENGIPEVYRYLKRVPKTDHVLASLKLLGQLNESCKTPICAEFTTYLIKRIEDGKSVKEFIELSDQEKTEQLVLGIRYIEENKKESYLREFSVRHFDDSKIFETMLGTVGKVMRRFGQVFETMDVYAILSEYSIYSTPNYVYFKGNGTLRFGTGIVNLKYLKQGIGISGEDLSAMVMQDTKAVKKVITIENLTTFFRWSEANSLIIYLGGYHNSVRRKLLKAIYEQLPEAAYLHFGDIDIGGFEIYEDLCRKTGIPFQPYYMDLNTLKQYEGYAKKLSENDKKRLVILESKSMNHGYTEVLSYMAAKGIKLEQEVVEAKQAD